MEILNKRTFCIKMWEIPCVSFYILNNTKFFYNAKLHIQVSLIIQYMLYDIDYLITFAFLSC